MRQGSAAAVPDPNIRFLAPAHIAEAAPRQAKLERPSLSWLATRLTGGVMVCPGVGIGENTVVGGSWTGTRCCSSTR